MESTLQSFNIRRQAYHSGAFVGNHVHHALQTNVIAALTSAPLQAIQSRTTEQGQGPCPSLLQEATIIRDRYHKLLSQYSTCRKVFSSKVVLMQDSAAEFRAAVITFLATCREEITSRKLGNITPKLNLLEAHVLDCMRHFGMGLGLLGEQGMESIHAKFNTLQSKYNAVPSALGRLRMCAEQHLLSTLPKNKALRPQSAARKRKISELE